MVGYIQTKPGADPKGGCDATNAESKKVAAKRWSHAQVHRASFFVSFSGISARTATKVLKVVYFI